jgi:glycosyltransferase involved in cell wall biosynthesis
MQQIPVSIVMCTYNGVSFLKLQIESILAQSHTTFELLVVDDASSDGTVLLLQQYQQQDNRISIVVNETNLGYNKNFEKAFKLAKHNYIAISDQDDIWHTEKIEIMLREWPAGSEMVYTISSFFDSDNHKRTSSNTKIAYKNVNEPAMLVFDSPIHGHACMVKKDFALSCAPYPDDVFYDWWLSMFAASKNVLGVVPQTLTWHRMHNNNSSRTVFDLNDQTERNNVWREQRIHFLNSIFKTNILPTTTTTILKEYQHLLNHETFGKFSLKLFLFFIKHRHIVFHYKRKIRLLSVIKKSYYKSFWGV